jgi:hypothetical protein
VADNWGNECTVGTRNCRSDDEAFKVRGQSLIVVESSYSSIFSTANVPSGMYVLQVKDQTGETHQQKIVVKHD